MLNGATDYGLFAARGPAEHVYNLLVPRMPAVKDDPRLGNMGALLATCITLIDVIRRLGIDRRSTTSVPMNGQTHQTGTSTAFGGRLRLWLKMDEDEIRKLRR